MNLLLELLNSRIAYEINKATSSEFKTSAMIGGRLITFTCERDDDDLWEISFAELGGDASKPWKHTFSKTGSGSELQVFSMVIASCSEFMARYKPQAICFTADVEEDDDENARARLYAKIASRYLKGWKVTEIKGFQASHFKYVKPTGP